MRANGPLMPRVGHPPLNIGHRGNAATLENTLPSFREALKMGACMVELDTRLSKDGIPMVIHDDSVRRISAGKRGKVAESTAARLSAVDLGRADLRVPTLAQVLKELTPRIPVNVELKYDKPEYRPLATEVCAVIRELGVAPRILISSFHHAALRMVEKLLPDVSVAPLMGCLTGPPHDDDLDPVFARARRKDAPSVFPFPGPCAVVWNQMIDADLAKRFGKAKATLLTYTVDEPEEMNRLIDLGIDGIITNRPDVLERVLGERFGDRRFPD